MKHTCKKRRERGRSPGRKEKERRALKALAAAGAIAGGTQAYAAPVRFDNPPHGEAGHYHWPPPIGDVLQWIDVTQGAEAQPGVPFGASSFRHVISADGDSMVLTLTGLPELQVDANYAWFAEDVNAGEAIPSGLPWSFYGYIYYPGYGSYLPEGSQTYLGVRFDQGSGVQHGWIGVVRTGNELEASAWGHETEAGVPIAAGAESAADIPTVSEWGLAIMSLALLAAGTWVVRKRIPQPKPPAAA